MPKFRVAVDPEPDDPTPKMRAPRPHAAGLNSAIALLEEAARTVPLPEAPYPIVIADYGVGTGRNSMRPIAAAIAALRGRTRPEHSVLVTHTDNADNDFTAVFRGLADNPDSYLRRDTSTYPSAVGRSFYTQILPSKSVHVGWSAWAIVRVGRMPMPSPTTSPRRSAGIRRWWPPTRGKPRSTGTSSSRSAGANWPRVPSWWC